MIDYLLEGFDYDCWANKLWANAFEAFDPEILSPNRIAEIDRKLPWAPEVPTAGKDRASEVFVHLLCAQRIWLSRCRPPVEVVPDALGMIEALSVAWKELVAERDLSEIIAYQNSTGQAFQRPFGEIVRHVLNHGTYHRGQLREIAHALGVQPIPETDMILFFMQKSATR